MVDTHAHIYHEDESIYPMIDKPFRPDPGIGTLEHLQQNRADSGVDKVVLVQTGSAYRWDNRLLADTAKGNADWTVGVCTLDPTDPDSVEELARLRSEFNVRGVRIEPTKEDDPRYDHPGHSALWEAARSLDVVVCSHVQSRFLPELAVLLERYPEVPVVLDHAAYPKASDGVDSDTVRSVIELARFRQLHIKMSFAVTGSDEEYPFGDTHAIVRAILDAYGADRCMWGSDFPCEHWLKKASYSQHLDVFRNEIGLSDGEQDAVLNTTASRIWFS